MFYLSACNQAIMVIGHVFVNIFLYCILELFQQCGMFCIFYFIISAYNYNLIAFSSKMKVFR
jgi:hypothetical protein